MTQPSPITAHACVDNPHFVLQIEIDVTPQQRPHIAARLCDYLAHLQELFYLRPGYLASELHADGEPQRLVGRLHWRRREDWEAAWDCRSTASDLFADSLLKLGARSIRFGSGETERVQA
ncbi:antibiotic biosynthesis monooxygenase [Pseudomonas sp. PDNC002]|uniref:antibiotic biosynthesis monooxygenase n=1 Tax=Pseudomonas sp. PDNC002 TaxID=2811422 RepID=UPI001964223D|nr:antibiotic biosynthesis monooxygenase [Pseudomonas sp. PDNC002]QRY78832.1 antibiotic biosynthesis monooxygenase [Pseudomonas sp. PDNC002]